LEEVSRYLGHASTVTTRRYAQQTTEALGVRAADALARAGLVAGRMLDPKAREPDVCRCRILETVVTRRRQGDVLDSDRAWRLWTQVATMKGSWTRLIACPAVKEEFTVVSDLRSAGDGTAGGYAPPDLTKMRAAREPSPRGRRVPIWSPAPGIVVVIGEPLQDDSKPGSIVSRLAAGGLCIFILVLLGLLALHSVS